MSRVQVRITLDAKLWTAVEAVADLKGTSSSKMIERALNLYLDPVQIIETAAQQISESRSNIVETRDQVAVISDFIIDLYRDQNIDANENGAS